MQIVPFIELGGFQRHVAERKTVTHEHFRLLWVRFECCKDRERERAEENQILPSVAFMHRCKS